MSAEVTFYLHAHQPWRVRAYSVFDIGNASDYFNEPVWDTERNNQQVLQKVAEKSYRPMNTLLLKLLRANPHFKVSLSITGTLIEQLEQFAPDVLRDFQELVSTGQVEIVGETYYHSLAFFYSPTEFARQVKDHENKIKQLFGVTPRVLRNTELAYNDELAKWADAHGYKGILAEGWDPVLEWRSSGFVYRPPETEHIGLLLKNYRLSDDLAFRFGNRNWEQWPLTADRYVDWLNEASGDGGLVNLFMDYETFGEHQWSDTGIFAFFEDFVARWTDQGGRFNTVSETVKWHKPVSELSMPQTVTWADSERDLTAWTGNAMQREALHHLYALEGDILRSGDIDLIGDWRKLQTSDHVYYICTKWFRDGDVHAYFSPYESPYDAFLYLMNAIRDLRYRLLVRHNRGNI